VAIGEALDARGAGDLPARLPRRGAAVESVATT